MVKPVYTFPAISFIGGETKKMMFTLLTERGNDFDASECSACFAIINYANKNGSPILTKDAEIIIGNNGVRNIVSVELSSADTLYMHGRFIYQISLVSPQGDMEIPGQGIIDITRNIHPQFIK